MFDFLNPILGRHPERNKANVEIYTWQTCPFCIRAKMLLTWKGVNYTEFDTLRPRSAEILGSATRR
jgi:glutaredoxin 3